MRRYRRSLVEQQRAASQGNGEAGAAACRALLDRNIAYAPDFIVNAGGMMRAGMPIFSEPDKEKARKNIAGLFETIGNILQESRDLDLPTETVAESIAIERIDLAKQKPENMED